MSSAAERVLEVARAELGTREKPSGSNSVKYNRAYYGRDVRAPWCVVFQWWCFQKAGVSTSVFPKANNVFAVRDWYRARGRFSRTPRVGSLVIFGFSHIGIVEKVLPGGRVQTIEGNTDASGSRTGGRVMRKVRSRGILGYCHPDYASAGTPRRPARTPREAGPKSRAGAGVQPVYTAVFARNVRIPARTYTTIQFTEALANEAKFWSRPQGGKGGYAVARGAGVFVADVTLDVTGLPAGSILLARMIETDPAQKYKRVQSHAPAEFRVTSSKTSRRHAATTSRLESGRHLWLQVYSREDVVLPLVKAEVVVLPSPR